MVEKIAVVPRVEVARRDLVGRPQHPEAEFGLGTNGCVRLRNEASQQGLVLRVLVRGGRSQRVLAVSTDLDLLIFFY